MVKIKVRIKRGKAPKTKKVKLTEKQMLARKIAIKKRKA